VLVVVIAFDTPRAQTAPTAPVQHPTGPPRPRSIGTLGEKAVIAPQIEQNGSGTISFRNVWLKQ
jgi:hypothetical protein